MQKFVPKAIPMHQKLLKSPGARTVAFILVIAVGIVFIQQTFKSKDYESQTFSTWDNSEKNAPDINGPSDSPGKNSGEKVRELRAAKLNETAAPIKKAESFAESATAGSSGSKTSNSWQIIFLEVPRNTYDEHFAPLEGFADGTMHGGMVNNSEEFLKNLKGVRELLKESKTIKSGEPWEIFKGLRNFRGDDQDLGLHLLLQMGEPSEGQNAVQFSYSSQIPIIADRKIASVEPQGLTDSVKISLKGGVFLTGGISRKAGGEDYPLTGGPFEILLSPRFKESESEFVILILSK